MPQNEWPWYNPRGSRGAAQHNAQHNTDSSPAAHVLTAANLTGGAKFVALALTGALTAAETATTDTAANIVAAIPLRYPGQTFTLRIINASSGAYIWTVAGGTGVTINGTATIAQNTWREFMVTVTSLTAVTLQNVGTGTYS